MATYSKKIRKPIRSMIIRLLAKVDDPSVEILTAEGETTANFIERPDEDAICWESRKNGRTRYHFDIVLYDRRQDQTMWFGDEHEIRNRS